MSVNEQTCLKCGGAQVLLIDTSSGRRYLQCLDCWRITFIDDGVLIFSTNAN